MSDKQSDLTRRRFLAASATGLVTAGLTGLSPALSLAQEAKKETEKAPARIITRKLGRTGMEHPIVSMGVGACNNPGVVQASYEMGVRHFDTAANYQTGANEQMVGGVISKMGVRDKVFIASKIYTPDQRRGVEGAAVTAKMEKLLEGSLRRLRTDYVDILYVHDVSAAGIASDQAIMDGMQHLKDTGKVRAIGITTHSQMATVIDDTVKAKVWDVILTSFNFALADDTALVQAVANASKAGVGIVAMKTTAGGVRWPNPDTRQSYDQATIIAACLKWVLRNEYVHTIIAGYNNHQHLKEDFAVASNLELTDNEAKFLSDNAVKLGLGFCRQCRQCLASCPGGVDIPTLMRTHMYAAQYSDFYLARQTLDEIPKASGLQACTSCSECTAQCANTVDIDRRIDELKTMYC